MQQKMILKEHIKNSQSNSILIKTMLHKLMKHLKKQLPHTHALQTQKRKDITIKQEKSQGITSLVKIREVDLDSLIMNRISILMKFSICSLEVGYLSPISKEGDNKQVGSSMTHMLIEHRDSPAMGERGTTPQSACFSNNLLHSCSLYCFHL